MVYSEVKVKGRKRYNYLVHTIRNGQTYEKKRKYIGEGRISKNKINKEIKKFKKEIKESSFLDEKQKEMIEFIKNQFNSYLKKAGKSGTESFTEWFFTELTYNSNAIEGNSLSRSDTSSVINDNVVPKKATLREVNEAKNHKQALEFLLNYNGDINENLILKLHSIILKNIDEDRGKYRKVQVFVTGFDVEFPGTKEVPELMKKLIKWYKENKTKKHPLELAVLFSMKFVSIHPFTDGNGRLSRLLMNYILKKKGYPEINIYVKDRNNYLKAVRKANDKKYEMIMDFAYRTLLNNYGFLKKE